MKVAILAGGLGTRLSEETGLKPKPMVEIGGKPLLWHIMHIYAAHGFTEFVIALGYKGDVIKDYFLNYRYISRSLTVNLGEGDVRIHDGDREDWIVHLLDTGLTTQTGGRVKQVAEYIGDEPFMLTYGDGVSSIDLRALLAFHRSKKKVATVTAVRPPARFGRLVLDRELVMGFEEKPPLGEGWVSGGFFVFEPQVAAYIAGNETVFEHEPLQQLAAEGQLAAYQHEGFWQCMDTTRDVLLLDRLWSEGSAPWKIWR